MQRRDHKGEVHDHRQPEPIDALSEAGRNRAQALARALSRAGVSKIYTSNAKRTKETADPLAQQLALTSSEKSAPAAPAELAAAVRALPDGSVALIVGHSNTVPETIMALGASPPMPTIGTTEFDNLVVLNVPAAGSTHVVHVRYGAAS